MEEKPYKNFIHGYSIALYFLKRKGKKGKKNIVTEMKTSITKVILVLCVQSFNYFAAFSQNLVKIAATSARVALPFGLSRPAVVPVISSFAFAQCIAGSA